MPDLVSRLDGFIFPLQISSFWNHRQQQMVHLLLLIEVCPNHGKTLLFGHERVVLRNLRQRRGPSGEFAEAVVQEKVGDHFWRDLPIVTGVRGHDVTHDMDPNTNRLSLSGVKVKAVQHKAQERLSVIRSDTRGPLSRQSIPLKQVAFRTQMLPFGITTRWPCHRNLSVPGFEHLFDFLKIPQSLLREWEQLSLLICLSPFGKQILKMELDLPSQGLTMLVHLWLTILSKEQNGFCPRHAPLLVHADLKEFTDPASVGKCQHGQCATEKDAAIRPIRPIGPSSVRSPVLSPLPGRQANT